MKSIILASFEEQGLTAYRLAQMVKGKMSMQAVYDYINGKEDMKGERLLHLLDALGLEICSPSDSTRDTTRRPRKVSKPR